MSNLVDPVAPDLSEERAAEGPVAGVARAPRLARLSLYLAVGLILAGGGISLQLWRGGYRVLPLIGPWFVAEVGLSLVAANLLLARPTRPVAVLAALMSAVAAGVVVLSQVDGYFHLSERAWAAPVVRALGVETGAVVMLAVMFFAARRSADPGATTGD